MEEGEFNGRCVELIGRERRWGRVGGWGGSGRAGRPP